MSKYQLYYFSLCPYCQYVLSAIKSMPLDIELKNINDSAEFRNELMAGGGKTQVPCLKIETNDSIKWLYESRDIINYLKSSIVASSV